MIKNVAIFFFSGILLLGVIAGSVYGFAKIVDAATHKVVIPEVKTIEPLQAEKEIPTPSPVLRIKVAPVKVVSKTEESLVKPEPTQQNKINILSSTKETDFERDNDKEDVHEADGEKK
jgi:hypothetical protein